MSDRVRGFDNNKTYTANSSKMGPDIGPRKTMIVVVIVVGCFAVLWPKVFHPMFFGTADDYIKPSAIDKSTGCCDVFSETDVNTIKIMSELCNNYAYKDGTKPLSGKELVAQCKSEILKTCGIDISAVLNEKIRFGSTVKQIINEVRSMNGSLCLKYNYGIAPWRLGVPHRIVTNVKDTSVRQERPPHLRTEIVHPAFRERGSAIPRTQGVPSKSPPPRIVEGRPGPIPGMRPPMGGPGHVVPPSQKGSSMGIIMPIYTIGIVIFFTYTLMKLLFKKQPESVGGSLYPPVETDRSFRRDVFEANRSQLTQRSGRDVSSKIGDDELDQLKKRLRETEIAMERIVAQMAQVPLGSQAEPNAHVTQSGAISNGHIKSKEVEPEQPSVRIVGMETTASCEGGQKWNRPITPLLPVKPATPPPLEIKEPPQEIYLEGALPAQSRILVADAITETSTSSESDDDPAVVLAGKMTLSVISLDSHVDDGRAAAESNLNEEQEEIEDEIVEELEAIEMNGDDELVTESKYTTASNATAAEPEISDQGENTDEEDLIDDVEVNHVKHLSEEE